MFPKTEQESQLIALPPLEDSAASRFVFTADPPSVLTETVVDTTPLSGLPSIQKRRPLRSQSPSSNAGNVPGRGLDSLVLASASVTDETHILALIPGDYIGNAARTLPDAPTVEDDTREVTVDVPGRFAARVTFRRFHYKRGKMSRWFWTAESAAR